MVNKVIKRSYLALVFAFLYLPIAILIAYSFNDSKLRGSWNGFTLRWYYDLFANSEVLSALYNTFFVAIVASVIVCIFGTITAIGIYYMGVKPRSLIVNLSYIPVLNPDIVTAISLMLLYKLFDLNFGLVTLIISHVAFTLPYVVLSVLPKLKTMNPYILEAAMDLGATPFYALRKVIVPEIKPAIITGTLLAFTLSLDDFVISFFTTGFGVQTLSTTIFAMARRGINPMINALSALMFLAILFLLLIINKRTDILE